MKKLFKLRILQIGLAGLFGFACLQFGQAILHRQLPKAYAQAAPGFQVLAKSQVGAPAKHISMANYVQYRNSGVDWPLRSDGCQPDKNTIYKALPWLGMTAYLSNPGYLTRADDFDLSGACEARIGIQTGSGKSGFGLIPYAVFDNGGNSKGAWMQPTALGNWTLPSGSSAAFTDKTEAVGNSIRLNPCTTTLAAFSPSIIWGPGVDLGEDQAPPLFDANNQPGFAGYEAGAGRSTGTPGGQPLTLISGGTVLVRTEFNLTQTDMDAIKASGDNLFMYVVADDFYRVIINGQVAVTQNVTSSYSGAPVVNSVIPFLQVGKNVLAVQAVDKAVWNPKGGIGYGICYALVLQGPNVGVTPTPPPPPPPPAAQEPYIRAFAGDIRAGGSFFNVGGVCAPPAGGGKILTFADNTGKGSGDQFAALASKDITQLLSASLNGSPPLRGTGLSLANTGAGVNTTFPVQGGQFGNNYCMSNHYQDPVPGATVVTNNTPSYPTAGVTNSTISYKPTAGNQKVTLTLSGGSYVNSKVTLYVQGDVVIPNDLQYAGAGSWASPVAVPRLYVIASGNIYIGSGVHNLDGIFVAQPTSAASANTGFIYTCSMGGTTVPTGAQIANNCNSQLLVRGSFIAQRIKFFRSFSDVNSGTPGEQPFSASHDCGGNSQPVCAGEEFVLGPETYIPALFSSPVNGSNPPYDFITSLQPVL